MRNQPKLSWIKTGRWRGRYRFPNGEVKDYYYAARSKTNREDKQNAQKEWDEKFNELQSNPRREQFIAYLGELIAEMGVIIKTRYDAMDHDFSIIGDELWCKGRLEDLKEILGEINGDSEIELPDFDPSIDGMSDDEIKDVVESVVVFFHPGTPVVQDKLQGYIDKFLRKKKDGIALGEISRGRVDNYRIHLKYFTNWLGEQGLDAISNQNLLNYRSYLSQKVESKEISITYASELMGSLITFIKDLGDSDDNYTPPKVVFSKKLPIKAGSRKVEVFTDDEIKTILKNVTGFKRLCLLLMLNTGCTQKDLSDLAWNEVNLEEGWIERKRSKTVKNENTPVVRFKLWGETLALLKEFKSEDKERVLLNSRGGHLKIEKTNAKGNYTKSDSLGRAFNRLKKTLAIKKSLKYFRKSGANKLGQHPQYKFYQQFFLSQSAKTVAERHYVIPDQNEFDQAVKWLGEQFKIEKK